MDTILLIIAIVFTVQSARSISQTEPPLNSDQGIIEPATKDGSATAHLSQITTGVFSTDSHQRTRTSTSYTFPPTLSSLENQGTHTAWERTEKQSTATKEVDIKYNFQRTTHAKNLLVSTVKSTTDNKTLYLSPERPRTSAVSRVMKTYTNINTTVEVPYLGSTLEVSTTSMNLPVLSTEVPSVMDYETDVADRSTPSSYSAPSHNEAITTFPYSHGENSTDNPRANPISDPTTTFEYTLSVEDVSHILPIENVTSQMHHQETVLTSTDAVSGFVSESQTVTSLADVYSFVRINASAVTDLDAITTVVEETTDLVTYPEFISDVSSSADVHSTVQTVTEVVLSGEPATIVRSDAETTPSSLEYDIVEATTFLDDTALNATVLSSDSPSTVIPFTLNDTSSPIIGTETDMYTNENVSVEATTDLDMHSTAPGSMGTPLEFWTVHMYSDGVTDYDTTDDGTDIYPILTSTTRTVTVRESDIPVPSLCGLEVASASAHVCLCNSSLVLSNYTYVIDVMRSNQGNMTGDDVRVRTHHLHTGSGCWNVTVPLGGYYRIVVTALDGYGNNASSPTSYFYMGLEKPLLSVAKISNEAPSLRLFWQFRHLTYVDYVTICMSRNNAAFKELTWLQIGGTRLSGTFSYFAKLGSKYSFAVMIHSGNESVISNTDSEVLAPPTPEGLQVTNISTRSISLGWAHRVCAICTYVVRYQTTASPSKDQHVSCLQSQTSYGCTTTLHDLSPGNLYSIDLYALSYGLFSQTAAKMRMRTYPQPPVNVTVTSVSSQSISVAWLQGDGYRSHYHLRAVAPRNSQDVGIVPGNVTNFTFHNLVAGTRYIIVISASANHTYGRDVMLEETTLPTEPGPVDQLRVEVPKDPKQIRLLFLTPMWPNGILEGYNIKYIGVRSGGSQICSKDQLNLPAAETSVVIYPLKGGCNYTFTVQAENEVGFGPPVSVSTFTKVGIPNIPDARPPHPASKTFRTTGFSVTFYPNIFDDANGLITHIVVIIAEAAASDGPTRGNSSTARMATWAEAISNDVIPPYQISEPMALRDLLSARRRKRSSGDIGPVEIAVGTERCAKDETDIYCNGPLPQGRSYIYRFRGISSGGFADTKFSLPVLLPTSPHNVIIGISTALFSLLVIVIILSIIIIVRKFRLDGRGRYHSANMKDVELTRVTNNHHHQPTVISKQKYSRPVRLSEFTRDWYNMNADSNYGYSQEYEAIRKVGKKLTANSAVSPSNVGKNRYTNILPYDRTRVKLSPVDDEDGSDYINANYIPGFTSPREYIACQGPLPGTADDMWRMVWEQNVGVVVMVTQLVEKGKVKCDQYWPDDHKPVMYGDIQVTMTQTFEENDWNIKEFIMQIRDQRRHVRHWNFLSWPDHGVPESSQALLAFIRRIRSTSHTANTPIAVHCSAGVGRTGTFIVLDRLLQHIEQYDFVDIMGIVCEMRMHRNFMVQTEQQYVFIHRCLLDVLEERGLAPMPMMGGSLP